MSEPTQFIEANAILAAQEQDEKALQDAILSLYQSERNKLRRAAVTLVRALDNYEGYQTKEARV